MRTLHVAALPFPSPQGTQALLHQMLCALSDAGHDTHLLCYAHGEPARAGGYTVHRVAARGFARSLQSGPSLDKLWLDVSLARTLRTLVARLRPVRVIAHHVEAAAVALAVGVRPLTFIAHTSLRAELPVYFTPPLAPLLQGAGKRLDVSLIRRATHNYAVSPLLAQMLTQASGRRVESLPLPWPVAPPTTAPERVAARATLGLADDDEVALYAGNLDSYQGLDNVLPALSSLVQQRARLRILVATAAPTTSLQRQLAAWGLTERVTVASLADEPARRRVHAAADLALVPRHSPGGVPIKLLDAFARGLPVVAAARALAGLSAASCCSVIDGDSASAWKIAIAALLDDPEPARLRAVLAREYIEREHAAGRFVSALSAGSKLGERDSVV